MLDLYVRVCASVGNAGDELPVGRLLVRAVAVDRPCELSTVC